MAQNSDREKGEGLVGRGGGGGTQRELSFGIRINGFK